MSSRCLLDILHTLHQSYAAIPPAGYTGTKNVSNTAIKYVRIVCHVTASSFDRLIVFTNRFYVFCSSYCLFFLPTDLPMLKFDGSDNDTKSLHFQRVTLSQRRYVTYNLCLITLLLTLTCPYLLLHPLYPCSSMMRKLQ